MKSFPVSALLAAAALALPNFVSAYAVTLSQVHLCCNSCVDGVNDAVGGVKGATADSDKDAKTITITAADAATAQKAVDALAGAGYYGTSSDAAIKVPAAAVPSGEVHNLTVSNVHLCCKKCVTGFNKAITKVKGVTGSTAAKDATTFEIQGSFNAQEVIDALHAAGFSAKVG